MPMLLAEFNPMMFFLLLWGLFSWFSKKKKNQLNEKDQGEYTELESKEDIFTRIQKLQEHLFKEVEIFPSDSISAEVSEQYLQDDEEIVFEKSEIGEPESGVFDKKVKESLIDSGFQKQQPAQYGWLKEVLHQQSALRKLMVLKEVVGEPRSLKPYTGDYFGRNSL